MKNIAALVVAFADLFCVSAVARDSKRDWAMPASLPASLLGLVLMAALLVSALPVALGCKVPVFRYALEHWAPDSYEALIVFRGSLDEDSAALAAHLEQLAANSKLALNLKVTRLDTEAPQVDSPRIAALLAALEQHDQPEIILLYPPFCDAGPIAWRGALTAENIKAIVSSPARDHITRQIIGGESVVWILIPSGDVAKDKTAVDTMRSEIARQEKSLAMRDVEVIMEQHEIDLDTKVALRLGFDLTILDRTDPAEAVFLSSLLHSEEGLEELGEPIAIPVFGRGRTYLALAGKGINTDHVEESNRFLIDDCSCEVKRLNPGVDLLIGADWKNLIVGSVDVEEPTPTTVIFGADPSEGGDNSERETERKAMFVGWLSPWLGAFIALGIAVTAVLKWRSVQKLES
jgi:hypothetical protein